MEKQVAIANVEQLSRQRNLFLILTVLLMLANLGLTSMLLVKQEKIVMVPGLNQEVWTSSAGVSKSYLEETTFMFLPLLLDLNSEVISHKANMVYMYVAQDSSKYMQQLQNYFADAKDKYKQFSLSTYFAVKNLEIDNKALVVIAKGTLTSLYGEDGFQTSPASYHLSYQWLGGKLRLKEFIRLKSDQELEEAAAKVKQKEQNAREEK